MRTTDWGSKRLSRRDALGLMSVSALGRWSPQALANRDTRDGLSLPTSDEFRDDRVKYFPPTELVTDPELLTSPPVDPIESVTINTRIDTNETYGQNKNDRIKSGEEMMFSIMALPMDALADETKATWQKVNFREQMKFNFVSEPGIITLLGQGPGRGQRLGCTYRVNEYNQLQVDIFMDPTGIPEGIIDKQVLYDTGYNMGVMMSMQTLATTLGIVEKIPGDQGYTNLFEAYQENLYRQLNPVENPTMSFFPDQTELVVEGEPILRPDGSVQAHSNPLLQVNLANGE